MTDRSDPQARPVIAVGTGRCGTHFLTELFQSECGAHACHESDPLNESFHRYCQWNRLSVDDGGFLEIKRREIESARMQGKVFFEASAYLSLSIGKLFDAFRPRFILITRNPIDTINSLWAKGWYEVAYHKRNGRAPVGYHAVGAPHHFFSRLVPHGTEFQDWQALCRIGKLGWFWSALHRRILAQFAELPKESWTIVKLEHLDYNAYLYLTEFAGIRTGLSIDRFHAISERRPGALPTRRLFRSWSAQEVQELTGQVASVARLLGYDTDLFARWNQVQHMDLQPGETHSHEHLTADERQASSVSFPGRCQETTY